MRIAILGAGAIGARHAEAAVQVGVMVGRVVDQSSDRAIALAGLYDAEASTDPQSIWDDESIDGVVISVPNKFHCSMAVQAMRAGKDLLLEKPMALNVAECDKILSVIKATGRHVQIGHTHRFTPTGSTAKQIADSGDLGEIYHAKAHLQIRRGIPGLGGWFTTKSIAGGGALIDLGVHLVDLSLHLLGQPKAVAVMGKTYSKFGVKKQDYLYESMWAGPPNYEGTFDVDDHATAMIQFDSGATLDLQVSWACNLPTDAAPKSMMALLGDRGGLSFELFGDQVLLRHEVAGRNTDSQLTLPTTEPLPLQMTDFAQAVATRQPGLGAKPEESRCVMQIIDAIYRSSDTHRPVVLT